MYYIQRWRHLYESGRAGTEQVCERSDQKNLTTIRPMLKVHPCGSLYVCGLLRLHRPLCLHRALWLPCGQFTPIYHMGLFHSL